MSKDVLVDIDVIQEHPNRINNLMDRAIAELEALRREGYELYTLTMQKQQDCKNQMDDLSNQYRDSKNDCSNYHYQNQPGDNAGRLNPNTPRYVDAQEGDLYSGDLKKRYNSLDSKMDKLNRSKNKLEDIASQITNIAKTTEDLKQKSEYWNKVFSVTINAIIDLNNRG